MLDSDKVPQMEGLDDIVVPPSLLNVCSYVGFSIVFCPNSLVGSRIPIALIGGDITLAMPVKA